MTADLFQERMRALREAFLDALAADVPEVRRALEAGSFDHAAGIVHKIAGRAGTFGYAEVSERAGVLEALLGSGAERGALATAFRALEDAGVDALAGSGR